MPGRNRPSQTNAAKLARQRRARYRRTEPHATAWCPLCDAPFTTERGLHIHEGHRHKATA